MTDYARILKDSADVILHRWSEQVMNDVEPAAALSQEERLNSIPEILDSLSLAFMEGADRAAGLEIAIKHGEQRAEFPEYSLEDVLEEYRILRTTIFDCLEFHEKLPRQERGLLLRAIDRGLIEAAVAFTKRLGFTRADAEQVRALESSLGEARADADRAVHERDASRGDVARLEEERSKREMFVNLLVHDVLTPLTAAKANIEMLDAFGRLTEKEFTLVHRAMDGMDRTTKMIRDLLDANKVTAGQRLPLSPERCEIVSFLQRILDEFTASFGERFGLQGEEAVSGYWDTHALRRIVENLIQNAIKYGAKDAPIATKVRTEGSDIVVSIHNEGGGDTPGAHLPAL